MNLNDVIEISGGKIQLITTPEELKQFAQTVAETTAEKLIQELHNPDKPISEAEACKIYHRTRQTFSKCRKQGKIRYHLVGGGIVYFLRELEEDFKNL